MVGVVGGAVLVVERSGAGTGGQREKAHWSMASLRRRLRTWRARTARFLPDATVSGEVPA